MKSSITVICGHYGCGKTNLVLNLAAEAAQRGRRSVVVDMDVVNPYFRSSDYSALLKKLGVELIAPEIFSIFNMENADIFIDAGGDDVGATALGQLHRQIETAGYEMLYVVNRYRVLSTKPEETLPLLREIETASHLKATAVVNNSNLAVQTDMQTVLNAVPFAKKAAELCHLPLLYSTVPDFAVENTLPEGFKAVKRYVRFVWEDETE